MPVLRYMHNRHDILCSSLTTLIINWKVELLSGLDGLAHSDASQSHPLTQLSAGNTNADLVCKTKQQKWLRKQATLRNSGKL